MASLPHSYFKIEFYLTLKNEIHIIKSSRFVVVVVIIININKINHINVSRF